MVALLTILGVVVAVFVGFNIGGSSTGVAFGPAVGSRLVRKPTAATLFLVFAFFGAWTVGRNVIATMSSSIVPATQFTPLASVVVLFFYRCVTTTLESLRRPGVDLDDSRWSHRRTGTRVRGAQSGAYVR
ncbi:MAG: phosphate/sulfate permease [Halobacteriales archaeon]|jgi:phosphate/sulfate permease